VSEARNNFKIWGSLYIFSEQNIDGLALKKKKSEKPGSNIPTFLCNSPQNISVPFIILGDVTFAVGNKI